MSQAAMVIALVAGAVAELWNAPPYRRWPWLTLCAALLIGLALALQTVHPNLVELLAPDSRLVEDKWWRAGANLILTGHSPLADLAFLLILGTMAERRFNRLAWLAVFLVGGLTAAVVAPLWQQGQVGASLGCFALAGALCSDWREGRERWWRAGAGLLGSSAAAVLLMERDVRGLAFLVGLVIGFGLALRASIARKAEFRDNIVPIAHVDTYH